MTLPPPDSMLGEMMSRFPRAGRVEWIGLRPARAQPMRVVKEATAIAAKGLHGDRYAVFSGIEYEQ